jgi:hypothetical protein
MGTVASGEEEAVVVVSVRREVAVAESGEPVGERRRARCPIST